MNSSERYGFRLNIAANDYDVLAMPITISLFDHETKAAQAMFTMDIERLCQLKGAIEDFIESNFPHRISKDKLFTNNDHTSESTVKNCALYY